MKLSTRLAITQLAYLVALCVLLVFTGTAIGKIGVAAGFGPSMPHPLTPHVGRVYWKPGNRATRAAGEVMGPTAIEQYAQKLNSVPKAKKKMNCDYLEVRYMLRHGVTTPRPLEGFHGCQKAAMDQRYWSNTPSVSSLTVQIETSVHNVVLPW